jgi:hypothetical protein
MESTTGRISSRMRSAVGPFQPLSEPAPNFLTDFRNLQNCIAIDFDRALSPGEETRFGVDHSGLQFTSRHVGRSRLTYPYTKNGFFQPSASRGVRMHKCMPIQPIELF